MAEQKTKRVTFHLPLSTVSKIEKLAARENQDVSKIIRKAIDTHLSIQANKDDIDFISGIIRQEVKAEIGKQANRLGGALAAIPLYELSQNNENVRDYIVSEESLRATLCGNYPEYVKSHNMTAAPESQIKDADAPPYLFLQKQFDLAAQTLVIPQEAEHELELER